MKDFAGVLIDNKNTLAIALQRHSMTVVGVCCHIEILLKISEENISDKFNLDNNLSLKYKELWPQSTK